MTHLGMPEKVDGVCLRWSPPHHGRDSPHRPGYTESHPMPTSQAEVRHICAPNRQHTDTSHEHAHTCTYVHCTCVRTYEVCMYVCTYIHICKKDKASAVFFMHMCSPLQLCNKEKMENIGSQSDRSQQSPK